MEQTVDVRNIARRVYAAAFEDGLTEIMVGAFLCIMSAVMQTPFSGTAIVFLPALLAGLKKLKSRYTYPRTGYAEGRAPQMGRLFGGILLFSLGPAALFILVYILTGPHDSIITLYRWIPVPVGCMLSGGMYFVWKNSGLVRFACYAALSPLAGALVAILRHERRLDAIALWALVMGMMFAASGAWHFARFLRIAPRQP